MIICTLLSTRNGNSKFHLLMKESAWGWELIKPEANAVLLHELVLHLNAALIFQVLNNYEEKLIPVARSVIFNQCTLGRPSGDVGSPLAGSMVCLVNVP